jgi:hypothetical protein
MQVKCCKVTEVNVKDKWVEVKADTRRELKSPEASTIERKNILIRYLSAELNRVRVTVKRLERKLIER